jgi:tRNA(Ile)-lysidine synthase TilS/MesJ
VEKRVGETIKKYKMISHTDKVLVAVSGGKDSLNLWNILHKLGYSADGFYVDLGIGDYSEKSKIYAKEFANAINRKIKGQAFIS